MVNGKIDFAKIVDTEAQEFPEIKVLNEAGEIIAPDLDPQLSDEQLVELFRAFDDLYPGFKKLRPDHEGHQPTNSEEEERGDQIHVPNNFVVSGGNPLDQGTAECLTFFAEPANFVK